MRTIRRLLQSLHWPNLHHEFLKWVRNSSGAPEFRIQWDAFGFRKIWKCRKKFSKSFESIRVVISGNEVKWSTRFSLWNCLASSIQLVFTLCQPTQGYEVTVRDFLRSMEEAKLLSKCMHFWHTLRSSLWVLFARTLMNRQSMSRSCTVLFFGSYKKFPE